jgi:hypothetical protein
MRSSRRLSASVIPGAGVSILAGAGFAALSPETLSSSSAKERMGTAKVQSNTARQSNQTLFAFLSIDIAAILLFSNFSLRVNSAL